MYGFSGIEDVLDQFNKVWLKSREHTNAYCCAQSIAVPMCAAKNAAFKITQETSYVLVVVHLNNT